MNEGKGIELAGVAQGTGEPLVFLHGWAADKTVWRNQLECFCRKYNVTAPDLRGHGFSGWQPAEDLFSAMAGDVTKFLESKQISGLKSRPVTVVGWSWGGQIALRLALDRPEAVKSLVLVSVTPKFVTDEKFPYGLSAGSVRKLAMDIKKDFVNGINNFQGQLFCRAEIKEKRFRPAFEVLTQCVSPNKSAALAVLDVIKALDLRPELKRIKVPTLIIHGTEDVICPVGAAKHMANEMPHARLELMEKTGHVPHLTHPREFNQILEFFLT